MILDRKRCFGFARDLLNRSGARKMAESAALLVDDMLPNLAMGIEHPFSTYMCVCQLSSYHGKVLGIVYRKLAI